MPYLVDERFSEIAALVDANDEIIRRSSGGSSAQWTFSDDAWRKISGVGFSDVLTRHGASQGDLQSGAEVFALSLLVGQGSLSSREAESYLSQKFPNSNWTGGDWGDQRALESEIAAADGAAKTDSDPERDGSLEAALKIQQARSAAPDYAPPGPASGLRVGDLPGDYDPDAIQEVIDRLASSVSARLAALESGRVNLRPHSVDGATLIPGSIPASAIDPVGLRESVADYPSAASTVKLSLSPSLSIDRHHTSAGDAGPGRVFSVTKADPPRGFKPGAGPMRVRAISAGQRFGITHIDITDTATTPVIGIRYGCIIHGIPSFGRSVKRIVAAEWVGPGPLPFDSIEDGAGVVAANPRLYEDRARANFETGTPAHWESFGGGTLLPSIAAVRLMDGISFGLITGRTPDQVWQQLNSRAALAGQKWGADGNIQGVTSGHSGTVRPPATGQVLEWDGVEPGAVVSSLNSGSTPNLGGRNRIVDGVPFLYDDCASLKMTDTHFSVVVELGFSKSKTLSNGETWTGPQDWDSVGLKAIASEFVSWDVDLIVM